jgi:hypothetical protein
VPDHEAFFAQTQLALRSVGFDDPAVLDAYLRMHQEAAEVLATVDAYMAPVPAPTKLEANLLAQADTDLAAAAAAIEWRRAFLARKRLRSSTILARPVDPRASHRPAPIRSYDQGTEAPRPRPVQRPCSGSVEKLPVICGARAYFPGAP